METNEIVEKLINEARITFNKREPKYNQFVIVAGGGGSGKGFVIDKLLGVKGKILDVDALKTMALKSVYIKNSFKEKYKIDISELDLKNPKNTSLLHDLISQSKLDKDQLQILTNTINPNNQHKPNIIIDNTLSNLPKFSSLCFNAHQMGYDKKDIHLVWVLNKLSIALKQNKERERVVLEDILISTHYGANLTVKEIIKYFDETSKENMDGDIWIVFNAAGEDTNLKKSNIKRPFKKDMKDEKAEYRTTLGIISSEKGGSYLEKATYIKVKEAGKPIKSLSEFSDEILKKLETYHKI